MAFRKNKPGCPCCACICPDEVTGYPRFSTMRIVISGLGASYDYYNELSGIFSTRTHDGTVTGLDAANGTYILRSELEATMNVGCVVDGEESYPVGVYEEEFTLYYTEEITTYPLGGPCDTPLDTTVILYEVTFRLQVLKEGPHWYSVRLFTVNNPALLSGCQAFACENNFDATTDGTLTDSQKEHNEFSFPDIAGELCSDGDIWFTPFSFSTNASSTICGVGRVFADMEVVGTITATLA